MSSYPSSPPLPVPGDAGGGSGGGSGSGHRLSPLNYIVGFLMVGLAWGLTTPFIRRAARDHHPPLHPMLDDESLHASPFKRRLYAAFFAVTDLLRNPRYAIPLVINLTGSVWFFLLIGQAELSLTVPITNTLAFLFTVIGEWWVESKLISRDTMLGMVLSLCGIALCVHSKIQS